MSENGPMHPSHIDLGWTNKLAMGLFLPIMNGGWSPSLESRGTDWTFDYNRECVACADAMGFEFAFGIGQWHRKHGWGGETDYHEVHLDPLITSAALAGAGANLTMISTVNILYSWHPTQLAKMAATMDHISDGRTGLNIVTGYKSFEFKMFGQAPVERDDRYRIAEKFMDKMLRLWSSDTNVTDTTEPWPMEEAFVTPKPRNGRPLLVNAGASPAGVDFARKYSDILFIGSPAGYASTVEETIKQMPAYMEDLRGSTARETSPLKYVLNPLVICAPTDREAKRMFDSIADKPDKGAVDGLVKGLFGADHSSWKNTDSDSEDFMRRQTVGGNTIIVGSPETVADRLMALHETGVDGVQLSFFDFLPQLDVFDSEVLPLLKRAGYR